VRSEVRSSHPPSRWVSGPGVGAVDELGEVRDEVGAHSGVAVALFGVVADHEPLGAVAVPAGCGVGGVGGTMFEQDA